MRVMTTMMQEVSRDKIANTYDEAKKTFDEQCQYQFLTMGRNHCDTSLWIVFGRLSQDQIHARCTQLAKQQEHCTNKICSRKPGTCLAVGILPREADPVQTFNIVTNFPGLPFQRNV